MRKLIFLILLSSISHLTYSQYKFYDYDAKTTGLPDFKRVVYTDIAGAPKLDQPIWLEGGEEEIRTDKHGLAYPALFDWDKDGKLDLLVGEFQSGEVGSYLKVYLNSGTNKSPEYKDKSFYATNIDGENISAHLW